MWAICGLGGRCDIVIQWMKQIQVSPAVFIEGENHACPYIERGVNGNGEWGGGDSDT